MARLFAYSNLAIDFCGLLRTWHEEAKKIGKFGENSS
jgi:hypothetical protein